MIEYLRDAAYSYLRCAGASEDEAEALQDDVLELLMDGDDTFQTASEKQLRWHRARQAAA